MAGDPPPEQVMHLLTRAERLLARRMRTVLETEGCTLDAWRVLTLLSGGCGHHMSELADHAVLPAATLTKLVDHLVDENLVYRRVDQVDRRRIRVCLTSRGRAAYQRISHRVQASWRQLPTADDSGLLGDLLARLVGALDATPDTTTAVAAAPGTPTLIQMAMLTTPTSERTTGS